MAVHDNLNSNLVKLNLTQFESKTYTATAKGQTITFTNIPIFLILTDGIRQMIYDVESETSIYISTTNAYPSIMFKDYFSLSANVLTTLNDGSNVFGSASTVRVLGFY